MLDLLIHELSNIALILPLENLLGPVGDLYCFSNTFRMLVLFTKVLSSYGPQPCTRPVFYRSFSVSCEGCGLLRSL